MIIYHNMNLASVIQTIKTDLLAQSWTSPSGTGTSKFQAGFNYKHISQDAGYPYFGVYDIQTAAQNVENVTTDFDHTIEIMIAVNYQVINVGAQGSLTDAEWQSKKKEEGYIRLREAFDFLRKYAVKNSTIISWFTSQENWTLNYSFAKEEMEQMNLLAKYIRLHVLEVVPK